MKMVQDITEIIFRYLSLTLLLFLLNLLTDKYLHLNVELKYISIYHLKGRDFSTKLFLSKSLPKNQIIDTYNYYNFGAFQVPRNFHNGPILHGR